MRSCFMALRKFVNSEQCAQVLVWSIADHVTTLTATGKMHNAVKGEKLQHRTKLEACIPPRNASATLSQAGVWVH